MQASLVLFFYKIMFIDIFFLDLESSQEHSLYPFNSDECIKKHFSHENLFMVTPKDVFSKRNVQVKPSL